MLNEFPCCDYSEADMMICVSHVVAWHCAAWGVFIFVFVSTANTVITQRLKGQTGLPNHKTNTATH